MDTFGRVSCDAAFSSACQKYFSQDEDGKHIDAAEFDKAGCLERSGMRPGEQSIFCCDSEAETAALNDEARSARSARSARIKSRCPFFLSISFTNLVRLRRLSAAFWSFWMSSRRSTFVTHSLAGLAWWMLCQWGQCRGLPQEESGKFCTSMS